MALPNYADDLSQPGLPGRQVVGHNSPAAGIQRSGEAKVIKDQFQYIQQNVFTIEFQKYGFLPSLPFYHTPLDTFDMVEKYIDPTFKAHESLARVMTDMILRLAESARLPLAVKMYIGTLQEAYHSTNITYGKMLADKKISLGALAILKFFEGWVFRKNFRMCHVIRSRIFSNGFHSSYVFEFFQKNSPKISFL